MSTKNKTKTVKELLKNCYYALSCLQGMSTSHKNRVCDILVEAGAEL